jgi:succinate dehydrogenase / fumarate reductase, flavoprotein subunit
MKEILVIGCGLAGTTAAIKCAEKGHNVKLFSPMPSERAQSVMAMGGINAALNTKGENDSPHEHYLDTLEGGCFVNNPAAVRRLTQNAPAVVKWLAARGVNFDRDKDGNLELRNFGGQKKTRTAYSGAHTGKQIITALSAECRKYEAEGKIERMNGWYFLSFVMDSNNECAGAVMLHKQQSKIQVFPAHSVIMATGGPNRIFGKTSGSAANEGTASGLALEQGLSLANLEMIQYHPTTVDTPAKKMLITEAARGLGGRLFTVKEGKRWYFMEEWYPERGALMPRDVVSRSIHKVCVNMGIKPNGKNEVYLDITHLPKRKIDQDLDEVVTTCRDFLGLDPHKSPIPVYPGIHYFMGGIKTDEFHRTNISRVYAAGECSAQYHGANRLGGNSVLGAVHGGMVAAEESYKKEVVQDTEDRKRACAFALGKANKNYSEWKKHYRESSCTSLKIKNEVADIMNSSMGIYRDGKTLEEALHRLKGLYKECSSLGSNESYYDYVTTPSIVLLAQAMVSSALSRRESRGAHQRTDYPETNDSQYRKTAVVSYDQEGIKVHFEEIKEKLYE